MRIIIFFILFSTQAHGKSNEAIKAITDAANLAGVDSKLLLAVCFVESSWRINLKPHLDGSTYSFGICQIKLKTAQHMDQMYKHKIKVDAKRLNNPFINAFYAAKVLKYQMRRYAGNTAKAIEAYNKGSAISNGQGTYVTKVFKAMLAQAD